MAKKKKSYNLILYELQQEALMQEMATGHKTTSNIALEKQAKEEYLAPISNANLGKKAAENTKKTTSSSKSTTSKKSTKEEKRTWFSKGAFSDGYDFGDITKTILGTAGDIGTGAAKGIYRMGEGLADLVNYGIAGVDDLLGNDYRADIRRKNAMQSTTDEVFAPLEEITDPLSVIGEKGDSISEGLGYVGGIMATGGLGTSAGLGTLGTTILTTGVTGLSSMGGGMSEAYQGGATDEEALKYGIIAGVAEAGSELIFGGLGKAVNAVGLSKGLSSLDDALAKKISSKISSTVGKNLAEYTVKSGAEGVEEIISGIAQGIGKKMTYMSDEDLVQILKDENLLEQFIVGTVTSSIAQAPGLVKTTSEGKPFISDNTQDNQAQIEGLQQEITKKQEEYNKTQDVREKQIIQETINGLNEELNELTNAQQITDEKELRKQNFTYEAQETDSDIRKAVYESASQVMNNTETTHKFVDVVAKIAEEKGTTYKFTNNEQLKQLGYAKDNVTVNGLVNENGEVLINIDSAKMINTVVGHETTHLLEDTKEYEALKQVAIEYAKTKGDYDARIEKLTKLYEGTNADIEAELTSDIVGEYLFTDYNFVKELSVKQPTIFEKIKNFISDLVVRFKGTEQEKQLRQLQRTFEKAYKAQGTQTSIDTRYSLTRATEEQKAKAEELEKQGLSPEEIFAKTGAYRGADDIWRTEVDDSNSKINLERPDMVKTGDTYKLKELLKHPELYKTYPELKNVNVKFAKLNKGYSGMFNPNNNTIELDMSLINTQENSKKRINNVLTMIKENDPNILFLYSEEDIKILEKKYKEELKAHKPNKYQHELKSTLMHEIQHWIQREHGFAKGTNFEVEEKATKRYREHLGEISQELQKYYDEIGIGEWINENVKRVQNDEITIDQFFKEQEEFKLNSKYGEKIRELLDETAEYTRKYGVYNRDAYDLYRNTAGEIEAREVQKRIDYTKEQRQAEMPFIKDENTVYAEPYLNYKNGVIKYSLSEDTKGRKLSKEQKEYFKNVIPELKDENGNLKVLYHGTPNEFTQFNYDFIGTNGTAFGKGFYLTDDINIAKSYTGDNGNVMELYANITNPMSLKEITISKNDFKKFVSEIAKQDEYWIYDYGDIDREGFNKVLNYAVDLNYDSETNDVDLIHGILNTSTLGWEEGFRVLNKTLGYDGVIANEFGEGKSNVYVPFFPEQIKSITNKNPTSNPDINLSLSAQNEEIAPTGQWNVRGEDIKLQLEEAIAPLQEKIESLTEQLETVVNSNKQPTMAEEIANLMNIKETQSGSEYARAFFDLRDKYGQPKLYKALNEYYATGTVTEPNEFDNLAPTSQEIVEKQGQENFEHLPDDLMPPEIDETEFAPDEDTYEDVSSPVQDRDIDEVGNRKVKAYQYEHPEVRPYFQVEADNMLGELDRRIEGERFEIIGEDGYPIEWAGVSRQIPEDIAYLKDNYGYSYEQIEKGLKAIIEDNGAENNAVSKRLEILIDERLTNGYVDFLEGYPIPPNQEYKNMLIENDAADYYSNLAKTLDDADFSVKNTQIEETTKDIPLYEKIEPLKSPMARENTPGQQTTSMKAKTAQNGNTDVTEGKQRKWVKTSTESEVVNREILPDDLDQSKIFYQPITNKATLGTANAKLDTLGYDKAVEYFNNQVLNKTVKVEDIVLGERLIQEAIKNKDTKTAGELIQNVAILGTELGQKVQALSIIQRMTPEGQLKMLEKTINRGKTKGDQAFTDVNLTQEMKDKILNTYNEDGSYNQEELNKAVDEVKQQIADQMPSTMMDKVNAWRYLSMLGNPKTHIRNLVSNVAMKGTVAVKNALARTVETIAPIENRTKTWKAASDDVIAYAQQTTLEMKDVISGDSKYSETADIKAKREIFKNKVLEKVANLNSDLLEKEDWWFSKGAFESSFREFLTANGIETKQDIQNNPELIEKGKQYALEQSQIATFRQYSWLSNKIRDIENKNAATQIAVGAVLPFKKTPINIAKTGLSYSPLGFAKTLTYDIAQVKKGNMEASTLIDHIAQNTTGTALTLVGYMLAQAGFLNGAGDDDKEGKYDYQLGKQAYSINIGGSTYSLSWLSPVAMPLFVGTNMYEQLVEGEEWNADVVLETLGQTLDPLSEMSFLSSLDSVLSSYDSGVQRFFGIGEAMVQNYVTQFAPTLMSQIAATKDDTKRSTKVSGDSTMKVLEETYNKLIYKIPGLRETLEPSTDIWGNEIKQNENLFTRAFENFIAPYARKDSIATEIDEELKDLYSQTGDNGLLPSIPYNYVNFDGEKYKMSAEEYTDYKKMYGQTANDLLEDLFRTTTYKNATSEEKADMVNDIYDYARDEAKLDYLAKEGVDYTNATEDKVEVYKENLIKGAVENDMTTKEYGLYLEDPEEYKFLMDKDYEYRRQYFDTYDSLKEIDESFEEQKEGINDDDELDTLYSNKRAGIVDKIINSGLEDTEKASLYKRYYNSDAVDTVMKSAINIDDYLIYTTKEFKADKNAKGNSIPGSRKEKVEDYVFSIDGLNTAQRAILIKSTNTFKYNDYNVEIVRYLDGLGLQYDDFVSILKDLDMTVKGDMVYWD